MKACVRPTLVEGRPLTVTNPRTGRPFPRGEIFTLTPEDLKHPRVRQLLPRSIAGGRDGDLLPADGLTKADRDALKVVADMLKAPPATASADPETKPAPKEK